MSLRGQHEAGLDVLGASSMNLGTFVPWLGMVSGALQGLTGGMSGGDSKPATSSEAATKLAIAQALAVQQQKAAQAAAQAKAEADARRSRTILYGVLGTLGVVGVGATIYAVAKRK